MKPQQQLQQLFWVQTVAFRLLFTAEETLETTLIIKERATRRRYRGADMSLARPGRKQANVSVRMARISFGALPCRGKKKLDDTSRLDVVDITRVPDMLPSFFPSWSGYGLISTPV